MRVTKKLGFENLISKPSLNLDSDGDGIVDGFVKEISGNSEIEFFFDPEEEAQIINVLSTNGTTYDGIIMDEFIPVVSGEYTLSGEVRVEGNIDEDNGPRLLGRWYNENKEHIGSFSTQPLTNSEWERASRTVTVPEDAYFMKIKLDFIVRDGFQGGTAWFRRLQFQRGDTPTDYEENDFFEIIPTAKTYRFGWKVSEDGGRNNSRCYIAKHDDPENVGSMGMEIRFFVPMEAADSPQFSMWMDIADLDASDSIQVFINGNLQYSYAGGWPNPFVTPKADCNRGWNTVLIRSYRGSDESTAEGAKIDDFEVTWEEEEPKPLDLPVKDVVKYIDFETDQIDPFFSIAMRAPNYKYGFQRNFRRRHTGYHSLGVVDTDIGGTDYIGVPPTIPGEEKAGASIQFRIPITADEAYMTMKAKFIARDNRDFGRIYVNGEKVWERSEQHDGWDKIEIPLIPGTDVEVLFEYEKGTGDYNAFDDSIYIDSLIVAYDRTDKTITYIATGTETIINTETTNFSVTETFESPTIDSFFTVRNPAGLISGGGSSQYPEAGWIRTDRISYQGTYSYRALIEQIKDTEDAAIDFTFRVPNGVENPKLEVWCFVETKRSLTPVDSSHKYPRLFDEFRIWVNNSIWKEFTWCSPNLSSSTHYSIGDRGNPANDYVAPWGRWWKETIHLTPGRTYTVAFECQLHRVTPTGTKTTTGKNIMAIDNLSVSWLEKSGEILTIPPEPLIFLDGRDGYEHISSRSGFESLPFNFSEYRMFGQAGSIHQYTHIEPRIVDIPILVKAENKVELSNKVRDLVSKLSNRPLSLVVVTPEGEERILNCRFSPDVWIEDSNTKNETWRKLILPFKAFDPFWYGNRIVIDGDYQSDNKWVSVINSGDYELWPIIKVYGPIQEVELELTDNIPPSENYRSLGKIEIDFQLPIGRHIIIDSRPGKKSIILDDGTNIFQYLKSDSRLWSIPQGEFGIKLTGNGVDDYTKVVVEYQLSYFGV